MSRARLIDVHVRITLALSLLVALASPTGSAHADLKTSEANVAEARAAFEKGAAAAAEERWGDALALFERSASLRPHATTTYNIGYCERALGRPTRAKKHFVQALAQDDKATKAGTPELTPQLSASTRKYLEEMRSQIATPKITIAPADASVSVDGRPLEADGEGRYLAGTRAPGPGEKVKSPTFTLELDGGAHEIVVVGTDGRSKVAHEFFPPGTQKEVRVELPPAQSTPNALQIDRTATRRTFGWVLGGAGLVAIGVGGYVGLTAQSTWSQAKELCPRQIECSDDAARLSARARTQANVATIAFVAGGAAVLGGVILVIASSPTSERSPTLSASALPGGGFLSFSSAF